jgi:Tetratricopeptide repeat
MHPTDIQPVSNRRHLRKFVFIGAGLVLVGGIAGYLILLSPGSIFVRWAQAAFPQRITMITFGPYPEEKEFQRFKKEGVKYDVSLLDPRLPYEKTLIDREEVLCQKYGIVFKDFPMASVFDKKVFSDYQLEQNEAVEFLKHIDGPAFVHCYLGKHRVVHVRDGLVASGVPPRYWTPDGTRSQEYWDMLSRLEMAQKEFNQDNFSGALEALRPITIKDVDVSSLRGWSHYRMGMVNDAVADFQGGLSIDPTNPRNLDGLGYCYLQQGQPVMAEREFGLVLEQIPDDEGALVGTGLANLALQEYTEAERIFQKVIAMDPSNNDVKGYLQRAEEQSRKAKHK